MSKSGLRTLDLAYIAVFTVLIAVCSWISVPSIVEFTMQTFAVFFTLLVLGGKRGTLTVTVYLTLGAIGVPVFAGFTGGAGALLGTSGGYLWGFLLTALVYWHLTTFLNDTLLVEVLALILGLIVCYAVGTFWFMVAYARQTGPVGFATSLMWCVVPFIPFDALKLALALALAGRLKRFVK